MQSCVLDEKIVIRKVRKGNPDNEGSSSNLVEFPSLSFHEKYICLAIMVLVVLSHLKLTQALLV